MPPSLASLSTYALCPSLSSFRFSPDANLDLGILNPVDDDDPPVQFKNAHLSAGGDGDGIGEFNAGRFGEAGDDDPFAGGMNEDYGGGGDEGEVDFFAAEVAYDASMDGGAGQGPVEPFDPRRATGGRDLVMSMDGGGEQMFDYFDQKLGGKNWAGPEHWKMRRVVAKKGEFSAV